MLINNRILLLNPTRCYIANEYGFGYQVPLGLVFIGGPLVDAGFKVKLVDADAEKLNNAQILDIIHSFKPTAIGISHTGSTAGHPVVVDTARLIKQRNPKVKIVYGGVYPTFAYRSVIDEVEEIDFVVRGEGEASGLELFTALKESRSLHEVAGIAWRDEAGKTIVNKPRPVIRNLDKYRPGWELVNWDLYKLLGRRASGVQFGRGCPNFCDFCGQWIFWKKWRHRSPKVFVDQIEHLVKEYKIEAIWPADEHFAADRKALIEILQDLASRDFRVSLSINTSVDAVLRDKDIMPLYKKAGVDFAAIGVESDNDTVSGKVGKGKSSYAMACQAVKVLQDNQIIACSNIIYGLEEENFKTLLRKCFRLLRMDPDFLNAMYLTPHFWTPAGSKTNPQMVIQADLSKWDYRHQVIGVPNLSALQLFMGVKFTEFILHCRPKRFLRGLTYERYARWMSIYGLWKALHVWLMEIVEHRKSKAVKPGSVFKHSPDKIRSLLPHLKTESFHDNS